MLHRPSGEPVLVSRGQAVFASHSETRVLSALAHLVLLRRVILCEQKQRNSNVFAY